LAMLMAMFMMGAALGSAWVLAKPPRRRSLMELQLWAAAAPLLLYVALNAMALAKGAVAVAMITHVAFPLLALATGMLGGLQFPAATRVFVPAEDLTATTVLEGTPSTSGFRMLGLQAGVLYALDFAGACLGALVLSTYVIPVFGFARAAVLIAVVNAGPVVLAALACRTAVRPPAA